MGQKHKKSKPTPAAATGGRDDAARRQQRFVLAELRRDAPGSATDDRWAQAQSFTGVVYVAIRKIYEGMAAATVTVSEYRPRVPAAGGPVKKSMPTPSADGRDQDYAPVDFDHPLAELFRRVNARDTLADFLTDWVISENLFGSCPVWLPPMQGHDRPAELWVLPVPYMTPAPASAALPDGGWYLNQLMPTSMGFQASAGNCLIPGGEVIRSRHRHPLYKWDGLSLLTTFGRQIDVLTAVEQARKALMDNEIDPSMIISVSGASQEELENLSARMESRHGQAANRRKVLALDANGAKVDFPTRAAKDMDFGTGYDQAVKAVLSAFGVPPSIAGLTEAGSYAQLYAAKQQFYELTIKPMCKRFSDFLTKHLAHRFYGDDLKVQLDVPPPNDEAATAAQLAADGEKGFRLVNEVRAARNLDPYPDGDVPLFEYVARRTAKVQKDAAPPEPPPPPAGASGPVAPAPGANPEAGPPRPANPEGAGSLGPRADTPAAVAAFAKAFAATLGRPRPVSVTD